MKAIENVNIPPFTPNFKQNANARKLFKPLTSNAHNLKTTQRQMQSKNRFEQSKSWAFLWYDIC